MKKNYFFKVGFMLLFTALSAVNLLAQNPIVTGTVIDEYQEPVIGASVIIDGTTVGVTTDIDGKYSIKASSGDVLAISYLGYETVYAPVNNRTVIDIALKADSEMIEELVVVGYGVQKKSHLTGSVASVDTKGMTDVPLASLDQMLTGKSAGLSITNVSSDAGDSAEISIRGMGSITSTVDPLVIVDGFQSSLDEINPSDIESIEILKDAASASIYGSRAAGGVILITTKSGSSSEPTYNVKYSTGIKSYYQEENWFNTTDYCNYYDYRVGLYNEYADANGLSNKSYIDGGSSLYEAMMLIGEAAGVTTDWVDYCTVENAQFHNLQASVSGGNDKVRYYLSGNYTFDQGQIRNNDYNKFNFRAKVDAKLSDRVDVGITLAPQYTRTNAANTTYKTIMQYYANEWMPIFHTQGSLDLINNYGLTTTKEVGDYVQTKDFNTITYYRDDGTSMTKSAWSSTSTTPGQQIDQQIDVRENFILSGNAYVNVKILDGLTFRSSNNVYAKYYARNYFSGADVASLGAEATGTYANSLTTRLLTENMFTYIKSIGKHDFNLLAGYTADLWQNKEADIQGYFESDYVHTLNDASEIVATSTSTDTETVAMESYLARLMYSYDDKYMLSASWRMDGSSKFGPNNRYGVFPSVSLGWRVTEEEWMKSADWLDQFKIRASYGVTGSDNIDNYAPYNTLSVAQTVLGSGSGSLSSGYANTSSTLGNVDLGWEQTNEWNLGFDFGFLNNRLTVAVDLYNAETQALLMEENIPSITGFDSYYNNVGVINNKGIELELGAAIIDNKDFSWNASFNISTNKNTLVSLGNGATEIYSSINSMMFLAKVGEQSVQFWGYKTDGLYMTAEEAEADSGMIEDTYLSAGTFRIVNNGDGTLDDDDRQVIGDPFPDFEWGTTHMFRYKNFDMSILIQGVQGGQIMSRNVSTTNNKKYDKDICYDCWFADVDGFRGNGVNPAYGTAVASNLTDYCVEDSSYAALRNVTIGYTLPRETAKKIGLGGLRAYLSGQNLFYIWSASFRGVNPEARTVNSNPLIQGYVDSAAPVLRTLSLGIDINF